VNLLIEFRRWFPNLTRAYGNNDRRPRQKFVFGILQRILGLHISRMLNILKEVCF